MFPSRIRVAHRQPIFQMHPRSNLLGFRHETFRADVNDNFFSNSDDRKIIDPIFFPIQHNLHTFLMKSSRVTALW